MFKLSKVQKLQTVRLRTGGKPLQTKDTDILKEYYTQQNLVLVQTKIQEIVDMHLQTCKTKKIRDIFPSQDDSCLRDSQSTAAQSRSNSSEAPRQSLS